MDVVGEVDRCRTARQLDDVALGSEHVDRVAQQFALDLAQEVGGSGLRALPVAQLVDDRQLAGHGGGIADAARLVQPMGRDPVLGGLVHLVAANLDLDGHSARPHHRGVQALVAVRLGHRDVILEAPFDRQPQLVHQAQNFVAFTAGGAHDPYPQQIVDFVGGVPAFLHLLVDGVEVLGAALHAQVQVAALRRRVDLLGDLPQQGVALRPRRRHELLEVLVHARVEVLHRQILQLGADPVQAQPSRQRAVDVHALARDAHAILRVERLQGAHVVQLVGELDQDHPHVAHHREQHLADRLGGARPVALALDDRDLGDPLDQIGHLLAERVGDLLQRRVGVLHHVVQQGRDHGRRIEPRLDQNGRHLQGMDDERIAGGAELPGVARVGPARGRDDLAPRVVVIFLAGGIEPLAEAVHQPPRGRGHPRVAGMRAAVAHRHRRCRRGAGSRGGTGRLGCAGYRNGAGRGAGSSIRAGGRTGSLGCTGCGSRAGGAGRTRCGVGDCNESRAGSLGCTGCESGTGGRADGRAGGRGCTGYGNGAGRGCRAGGASHTGSGASTGSGSRVGGRRQAGGCGRAGAGSPAAGSSRSGRGACTCNGSLAGCGSHARGSAGSLGRAGYGNGAGGGSRADRGSHTGSADSGSPAGGTCQAGGGGVARGPLTHCHPPCAATTRGRPARSGCTVTGAKPRSSR